MQLPQEMRTRDQQGGGIDKPKTVHQSAGEHQHPCGAIGNRKAMAWCVGPAAARTTSRRSARRPPCPDGRRWCIGADHPEERAGIEHQRRRRHARGFCGKAQWHAPVEGEPEPSLRPPGDALHEGIGGDQQKRTRAQGRIAKPVERNEDRGIRSALRTTANIAACLTLTAPLGIGRPRVRATRASMSRSTMSL